MWLSPLAPAPLIVHTKFDLPAQHFPVGFAEVKPEISRPRWVRYVLHGDQRVSGRESTRVTYCRRVIFPLGSSDAAFSPCLCCTRSGLYNTDHVGTRLRCIGAGSDRTCGPSAGPSFKLGSSSSKQVGRICFPTSKW